MIPLPTRLFSHWSIPLTSFERHVFQVDKKNVIANFEQFCHKNLDLNPDSATASIRIRIQENAWIRIQWIRIRNTAKEVGYRTVPNGDVSKKTCATMKTIWTIASLKMFRTWRRQDLSLLFAFLAPDTSIFAMKPNPPVITKQKNLWMLCSS